MMARCKTFETDWEFDVARADDVLDLEVCELGIETELLDDPGIFARGKLRVVFGLGTSHDHLARCKDQGRSLGVTDTHDDGRETLGIVFSVSGMQSNCLEIETAVKVDSRDDVPLLD